jgi:hypothetical protein
MSNDYIFTINETATFLKKASITIRRYLKEKELKGKKVGRNGEWRISKSSILQFCRKYNMPMPQLKKVL